MKAKHEEKHEDQQPGVGTPLHSIVDQDFKHEQQQRGAYDYQELPQPYVGKDSPVAPLDDAGIDEELTGIEVLEHAPGVHGGTSNHGCHLLAGSAPL
ncbi:hypothetical protein P7K49_003564 [Saguinus oedipus]|uniref:Uncharacterized protein n=1 Tax=Saguinus oedipus TaxID=9490 RepID=A0ABQ9W7C3_SAGOE|nr:hypothetical protein P7K49_003564 [Saguinus oedipus]